MLHPNHKAYGSKKHSTGLELMISVDTRQILGHSSAEVVLGLFVIVQAPKKAHYDRPMHFLVSQLLSNEMSGSLTVLDNLGLTTTFHPSSSASFASSPLSSAAPSSPLLSGRSKYRSNLAQYPITTLLSHSSQFSRNFSSSGQTRCTLPIRFPDLALCLDGGVLFGCP